VLYALLYSLLFAVGSGAGGGDARAHLRAGCRIISKPHFDQGDLHHIVLLHAVIGIRAGVVRAPYSGPSCRKPMPFRPIHEKAVESVPPGLVVGLN
jgi:hypothetical protein